MRPKGTKTFGRWFLLGVGIPFFASVAIMHSRPVSASLDDVLEAVNRDAVSRL